MSGAFGTHKEDVARSIEKYGFAAAIEVTNGLTSVKIGERTREKALQARHAKSYLERLTEGRAEIVAGIAYNGQWVDPDEIKGIDFVMDVRYEPSRLEMVAYEMLRSPYLGKTDKDLLNMIICSDYTKDSLVSYLKYCVMIPYANMLGIDDNEYYGSMTTIKGLCMELYTKSLCDEQLKDKKIRHRLEYSFERKSHKTSYRSEADLIIACPKYEFRHMLERFQEKPDLTTWVNEKSRALI